MIQRRQQWYKGDDEDEGEDGNSAMSGGWREEGSLVPALGTALLPAWRQQMCTEGCVQLTSAPAAKMNREWQAGVTQQEDEKEAPGNRPALDNSATQLSVWSVCIYRA